MTADQNDRSTWNRTRTNGAQDHEVRYWARQYKVAEKQLRKAVETSGGSVQAVGQQLIGGR